MLPTVVQHDEVEPDDVLRHSHLGVCLGLQGLVTAYGGRVAPGNPAHGEVAAIDHDGRGVFHGLPQGFSAVRYHSLCVVELPPVSS